MLESIDHNIRKLVDSESKSISLEISDKVRLYDQLTLNSIREAFRKKNSGYNEFGTISLWTPPPTINSEKSNSENWSQYRYPPSLKK